MKALKLLIGILLLAIGIYLAGGGGNRTVPVGTVRIDYEVNGK